MTTHKMIKILATKVTTKDEAKQMWKRILKGFWDGKLGSLQATELGIYLERVWGKEVIN